MHLFQWFWKLNKDHLRGWLTGNPLYHFLSFQFSELEDIEEKGSIKERNSEKVLVIIYLNIWNDAFKEFQCSFYSLVGGK